MIWAYEKELAPWIQGHRRPIRLFIGCAAGTGGVQPYSQNCYLRGGERSPLHSPGDHLRTVYRPRPDLYPSLPRHPLLQQRHRLWEELWAHGALLPHRGKRHSNTDTCLAAKPAREKHSRSADRFPGTILASAPTPRNASLSSAPRQPAVRATRVICSANATSGSRSTRWRPSSTWVRCTAQTTPRPAWSVTSPPTRACWGWTPTTPTTAASSCPSPPWTPTCAPPEVALRTTAAPERCPVSWRVSHSCHSSTHGSQAGFWRRICPLLGVTHLTQARLNNVLAQSQTHE